MIPDSATVGAYSSKGETVDRHQHSHDGSRKSAANNIASGRAVNYARFMLGTYCKPASALARRSNVRSAARSWSRRFPTREFSGPGPSEAGAARPRSSTRA
jgi:hypothetical protein